MIYSDLVAAIVAWVNRPEIEQSVSTFIALAEAQINRALAVGGVTGSVQRAPLSIAGEYVNAPVDLAQIKSLVLSTGERVENDTELGLETIQRLFATTGKPRYFTLIGRQFRFVPVPDTAYSAVLVYQALLAAVSDANPTNWVLTNYPDAYLYGALVQSAPFLGDDPRLSTWSGLFQNTLDGIITAEQAKKGSQETRAYSPNMPHRSPYGYRGGDFAGSTMPTSTPTPVPTPTPTPPGPVPDNTVLPSISGVTTVGHVLTADPGSWSNSPSSFAYVWKRGGAQISGATANTYLLVSGDTTHALTVTVIATNSNGPSAPATSAPTATISAGSGGTIVPFAVDLPQTGGTLLDMDLSDVPIGNMVTLTNTSADIVLDLIHE